MMRVLIATDGSPSAEEAAAFFAKLPHRNRLEVTVLSVARQLTTQGSADVIKWMEQYSEHEKKQAAESMLRIRNMFDGANVLLETVSLEGHPARTIVEEATTRRIDLIVVGGVGQSALDRFLLGSTSDFVATHAKCSVLIVRPKQPKGDTHSELRVLLPVDSSDPAQRAMQRLCEFEWRGASVFHVVNVMSYPFVFSDVPISVDEEELRNASMHIAKQAAQTLQGAVPHLHCHVLEGGHIGHAITEFANQQNCDLIFIGDTDRGLVDRILLGSVSRYILRHASQSIWLAR